MKEYILTFTTEHDTFTLKTFKTDKKAYKALTKLNNKFGTGRFAVTKISYHYR